MLVLSRHKDESIVIDLREWGGELITITVVAIGPDKVRLGIEALKAIPVHREEVWMKIEGGGLGR